MGVGGGGGLDQSTASSTTSSASAAIQAIKGEIFPASATFRGISVAEEMVSVCVCVLLGVDVCVYRWRVRRR